VLCTWDLDGGEGVFHEAVVRHDDMLVLSETEKVGFVLDPAPEGLDHRIFIGDVPLVDIAPSPDDAAGMLLGGKLYWRDLNYFDSARGATELILEARPQDAPQDAWDRALSVMVCILPSKLGEERYQAMTSNLEEVSRNLLVDLYGKSHQTMDIRYSKEGKTQQSYEQELRAIKVVISRLGPLLQSIGMRPASRVRLVRHPQQYWGGERLSPAALSDITARGIDPISATRPIRFVAPRKTETFDVPEHRFVRAFLGVLMNRGRFCAEAALRHVKAIAEERHLRDIQLGDGPTIYESVDRPRIERLQEAARVAQRSVWLARELRNLPFLRNIPSEFADLRGGVFQRNPEYGALFALIRRFLVENAVWYEGEDLSAVTKLTWRIFEQWTYLRIVDAFRSCGVDLREWGDALRQNLRSRFIIDFDRGITFEGVLGPELRIRFRYEPWIMGRSNALEAGETLCRGTSGEVAWCPDVVIECLKRTGDGWQSVYAIVLDCKYAHRVTSQHWSGIAKYLEIRSTETTRQAVKQLWLVSPSVRSGISSEDPAVDFSEYGPSCEQDEAVRFRLNVCPDELARDSSDGLLDSFGVFAQGTIRFLRRSFGAVSPRGQA